jgi:selenocysteine lyase/cysteine desulfurase
VRARFPALASGAAYLDGPGGSQVPREVLDAIDACLRESNANLGGGFATSAAADDVMERGRAARPTSPAASPRGSPSART